jgi:hypothetical protein
MPKLVFEKFGDLRTTYPYLCVYVDAIDGYPFMEISVTDNKEISFNIIPTSKEINLTLDQWKEILRAGEEFIPKVIADEDYNQQFHSNNPPKDHP